MMNFVKKGAFMLFVASFAVAGLTSCDDDDPNYDNVVPPVVEVAPNTVSGLISAKSGAPVANAKVTMGSLTATTDANGNFKFDKVATGTFAIKVEAEGMNPANGEVVIASSDKSQNVIWNATLAKIVKEEVAVSKTEETKGDVTTEAVKGNEKAEVKVETVIPASPLAEGAKEDAKIVISPVYSQNQAAAASRAGEATLLVGSDLYCTDADAKLAKAIEMSFNVDNEFASVATARLMKDGKWIDVKSTVEGGKVIVSATEFGVYALFLDVDFQTKKSTESINFANGGKFDNLYGAKDLFVGNVNFSYKAGIEIASQGTSVLTALLIEKLAQRYGAVSYTVNSEYPVNVTLPVGTLLELHGVQNVNEIVVSAAGKSVTGKRFGSVFVHATTINRQHSGGTN